MSQPASAASCATTVHLQREADYIFSTLSHEAAVDNGKIPPNPFHLKTEQTQFSQRLLIHDVLQPTDHLGGLHWTQSSMPSPSTSEC